jgi:lactoylglutathione lyase
MQSIGFFHFCLEVDDLDESAELMKSNNIPFLAPLSTGPDGTRALWIEDPDGNKIEFTWQS